MKLVHLGMRSWVIGVYGVWMMSWISGHSEEAVLGMAYVCYAQGWMSCNYC
jgi:hypothetical protein